MQPSPGSLLLQLALQLPPPAGLPGPHGVLAALMLDQEFEVSVALMITSAPAYFFRRHFRPDLQWYLRTEKKRLNFTELETNFLDLDQQIHTLTKSVVESGLTLTL